MLWALWLAWTSSLCLSRAHAQAELVLLLVPQTPDPAHVELYHRIEAELRLHGFRPEAVVAGPESASESMLGAQASAQRAFAAVAIDEQQAFAMLRIWIVDARTGLTREHHVEQRQGQEAASVVAVRAVDLLRANRSAQLPPTASAESGRSPAQAAQEPSNIGGARATPGQGKASPGKADSKSQPQVATGTPESEEDDREPVLESSSAPATTAEPEEARSTGGPNAPAHRLRLQLAAEGVALSVSRRIGWSGGPSLGAWLTYARWRLGLVVVAPLWGAVLRTPLGEANVVQQLAWLELGAVLVRTSSLQLTASAGGGLHLLQAYGHALMPLQSVDDATWSWTASAGLRADVALSARWSLGLTLRARAFMPHVEVAVWTESARLGLPAVEGALGISTWL
jgi:hypothetical protein